MIGGIVADWESHRRPIPSATASSANLSNADDDSMVKIGGIVSDDELDDVEREALAKEPTKIQKGGNAKIVRDIFINYSQPNYEMIPQPNIKISSITTSARPRAMTKKEAQGGDARWKLGHLPTGTDKKFTELVVPLAKIMAGTLPPWVGLDYNQVQTVVDSVFGEGKFVVTDGDVWCGLVSFSSNTKLELRISCTM